MKTEKNKPLKISIKDLFQLQDEVNAILRNKLTILVRYNLSELKKTVDDLVLVATNMRDELVTKYGEKDASGTPIIKIYKDEATKEKNPVFEEFSKEWSKILANEKQLNYTPIDLELIKNLETETHLEVIFRLLEKK